MRSRASQLESSPRSSQLEKACAQSLGWEDPLEKGKATHSSILAWRITWMRRSLVGYIPQGPKELD